MSFGFSNMHYLSDFCIFCCFLLIILLFRFQPPPIASSSALTSYLLLFLTIFILNLVYHNPKISKNHKNSQFQLFFSFRSHIKTQCKITVNLGYTNFNCIVLNIQKYFTITLLSNDKGYFTT